MRQQRPFNRRKPAVNEHRVGQYPNRDVSDPSTVGSSTDGSPNHERSPCSIHRDPRSSYKDRDIEKSCHWKHETRDRERYSVPSGCPRDARAVPFQRALDGRRRGFNLGFHSRYIRRKTNRRRFPLPESGFGCGNGIRMWEVHKNRVLCVHVYTPYNTMNAAQATAIRIVKPARSAAVSATSLTLSKIGGSVGRSGGFVGWNTW